MDFNQKSLVGDYILGPRIGSGSFAVVWRSRHRLTSADFAVKEIDKKLLSPKVSENLLKEISILSTINHPNIIRLFESIETEDKIFLVLEYCDGGDLAAYINQHGKVSECLARHFMRQLATGLQVLQEKNLIHRDLKPQNLLLSSNEGTPQLKIGDFGFARSLTPQGLADTLCGSPLYMAPEIIQNKQYDAKADLWSVGAILFQLVTGKPPFDGNSQYQLFQNILASTELQFPRGSLEALHPDCVDLCRSLLRQDPAERLTFKEFFKHRFLEGPWLKEDAEPSSLLPQVESVVELFGSACDNRSQLHSEHPLCQVSKDSTLSVPSMQGKPYCIKSGKDHGNRSVHGSVHGKGHVSISGNKSVHGSSPSLVDDQMKKPVDGSQCLSDQPEVADSVESIEKGYVLVDRHIASTDNISYYLGTSLHNSTTRVSVCSPKNDQDKAYGMPKEEVATSSVGGTEGPQLHGFDITDATHTSTMLREVQGLSILHPSARLKLLHEIVQAIAELAQEKHNAGLFLDSFSVELVVLAVRKKILQICSSWLASTAEGELPESSSTSEPDTSPKLMDKIEFATSSSVSKWAEQEFIVAFDRAEKLSCHLQDMDATVEMPDSMEIIFQRALTLGTSGAVDEYMDNKDGAKVSYFKALLLLYFIVREATSLPLNPPFSLTPANKKRIETYMIILQSRQSHFSMLPSVSEKTPDSLTK